MNKLEILWLNNNKIKIVDGINKLLNLKTLNLACNNINSIKDAFITLTSLENLNLSGNPITSFREILYLMQIKSLRKLSLNDPVYGYCPVAILSNYQTYCLYHLSFLTELDYTVISEEYTQIASTTYISFYIYY